MGQGLLLGREGQVPRRLRAPEAERSLSAGEIPGNRLASTSVVARSPAEAYLSSRVLIDIPILSEKFKGLSVLSCGRQGKQTPGLS